jgi:hypothetical protein
MIVYVRQQWPGEDGVREVNTNMDAVPRVGDHVGTPSGHGRTFVSGKVASVAWSVFSDRGGGCYAVVFLEDGAVWLPGAPS